jgi:hypothetical protein
MWETKPRDPEQEDKKNSLTITVEQEQAYNFRVG